MAEKLNRSLQSRHMSMIALGGSIGTGLFLAVGGAVAEAGPGGTVLAYTVIAIMVYFLMTSLGEMAAYSPTTGTFCEYSTKYVDPAFGFSTGWNYWFNWAITVAVEVTAAAMIMQYWFPDVPTLFWCILFFVMIFALNIFSVKVYGEVEYWLSFIKVSTVIIFIIIGILTIIGLVGNHGDIGFKNWTVGDAPFNNGFLGFLAVFMIAGFSFQGTELVGVTAGEAKDPEKSIPKAIKQTFWRLFLFYILCVVIISCLIPYNDPILINADSNVAVSPFTMVFKEIGLGSAATVMNFIILIAILSACNASMYSATRILWHLGKTKQAPKVFGKINSKGTPIMALLLTGLVGCTFLIQYIFNSNAVFVWLLNISSLAGFIAWFAIALSHYRFRKAYVKQGRNLDDLPYKAKLYPWAPIIALILVSIIIIGQGFSLTDTHYKDFGALFMHFLSLYIGLVAFLALYFIYKFKNKTKVIKLEECEFKSRKETLDE